MRVIAPVSERDRLPLGNPKTRTFAELLIDCEEDRTLRAVCAKHPKIKSKVQIAAHRAERYREANGKA